MAGQSRHHSSAAWYAPYETRHTHAKITNWPALRENHKCVSSSRDICRSKGWRLGMDRGGEEVRRAEMADRGSKEHQASDATDLRGDPPNAGRPSMPKMLRMSPVLAQEK